MHMNVSLALPTLLSSPGMFLISPLVFSYSLTLRQRTPDILSYTKALTMFTPPVISVLKSLELG